MIVGVLFMMLFYFSNTIYEFVAQPLIDHLPQGTSMIATNVTSPFFTPIKLTLFCSVFLSVPFLLHQLWGFVAPGLYKNERRFVLPLLISSSLLFYAGVVFAYYVVFPLIFRFFMSINLSGVTFSTDITNYLDFVLTLFMAFGLAFEVPVAIILLCLTGVTTPEYLGTKRSYIIVSAFIVGMLLTPPDVISQILLAVPMCLLFEIGLLLARFYIKRLAR